MGLDDRLADPEAESGPGSCLCRRRLGSVEALEETLLLGVRNPQSRVGHVHDGAFVDAPDAHLDASARGRELERIRDQVVQHLANACPVELELRNLIGVEGQREAALLGDGRGGGDRLGSSSAQVAGLAVERQDAGIVLGDHE